MELVPYEDTEILTPYEEGIQRLMRRVEALEANSGTWSGEEHAKNDTNAELGRLHRRIDLLHGDYTQSIRTLVKRMQDLELTIQELQVRSLTKKSIT